MGDSLNLVSVTTFMLKWSLQKSWFVDCCVCKGEHSETLLLYCSFVCSYYTSVSTHAFQSFLIWFKSIPTGHWTRFISNSSNIDSHKNSPHLFPPNVSLWQINNSAWSQTEFRVRRRFRHPARASTLWQPDVWDYQSVTINNWEAIELFVRLALDMPHASWSFMDPIWLLLGLSA